MRKEEEKLVLENSRLVHYFVVKFGVKYNSPDYDDFVSIGTIGLIKAAKSFEKSKGIKFATYASRCIQNEILMHLRSVKKIASEIALETVINHDKDGNEIRIADTITSDDKDIIKQLEDRESLEQFINIVLNILKPRDRLLMLYSLAEVTQNCIAEKLNISQSYISRLEKKLNMKVKSYINLKKQFKEVYSLRISDDSYKVIFSSKDVKEFKNILSTFLANTVDISTLPSFKVSCNNQRIMIQVPANQENFSFIAELIQQIDDFSMALVSGKETVAENTVKQFHNLNDANELAESQDISGEIETAEEDDFFGVNDADVAVESAIKQEATNSSNGVNLIEEKGSNVGKNNKVKQVRDYILSLESFTITDIKQQFPDLKSSNDSTISNAIHSAKSKGLIKPVCRGKYEVIRN